MPYIKDTLISRPASKGALGSFLDTIESIGKGALTFYGDQQKQAGAIDALKAQQPQVVQSSSSGPGMLEIAIGGAVVVGAVLLLTRKKKG